MPKIDPTRRELDRLRELDLNQREPARKALELALLSRSPMVVKRAGVLAVQGSFPELAPALIAAYHRQSPDPGCETKTALVRALIELESPQEEFFLAQSGYRQVEKAYGGPIETAGELRGLCALGLARGNCPQLLEALVDLLVDSDLNTRLMAARAAGDSGQPAAVPLLRLKAVTEKEPEVVSECLIGLLHLAPEPTCVWIEERFLKQGPWEAVVLALGASRQAAALALLKRLYRPALLRQEKQALLLAIASCRHSQGVEFLLGLLDDEPELARKALELYRHDPAVWSRVEAASASS